MLLTMTLIKYLRRPGDNLDATLVVIQSNTFQTLSETFSQGRSHSLMLYSSALLYVLLEQTYQIQEKQVLQQPEQKLAKIYDIIIQFMIKDGLKNTLHRLEREHPNR